MTEQETIQIIKQIKAYYPYLYKNITKEDAKDIVGVWHKQFKEIDYELVETAVDYWGERNTTAPSIAEIKQSVGRFYAEIDEQYSKLLHDKNADKKEIEKIKRWRKITWEAMSIRVR